MLFPSTIAWTACLPVHISFLQPKWFLLLTFEGDYQNGNILCLFVRVITKVGTSYVHVEYVFLWKVEGLSRHPPNCFHTCISDQWSNTQASSPQCCTPRTTWGECFTVKGSRRYGKGLLFLDYLYQPLTFWHLGYVSTLMQKTSLLAYNSIIFPTCIPENALVGKIYCPTARYALMVFFFWKACLPLTYWPVGPTWQSTSTITTTRTIRIWITTDPHWDKQL